MPGGRFPGKQKKVGVVSNLIASLPIAERIRLYRQMAAETLQLGEDAIVPEARKTFQRLSVCWDSLADELAQEADAEAWRSMAAE